MDRLFDVVTIFSLVLIVWVLSSVRRAHIRVEYSVSWLLAGAVLLVLAQLADRWTIGSRPRWAFRTVSSPWRWSRVRRSWWCCTGCRCGSRD